jgi:hypothetical protein
VKKGEIMQQKNYNEIISTECVERAEIIRSHCINRDDCKKGKMKCLELCKSYLREWDDE